MFICPQCNLEVADPDFVRPKPAWWQRRRWPPPRRVPFCSRGHKLRGIIGETTELPLPLAMLGGLRNSFLILALGMLQDLRHQHMTPNHVCFMGATGFLLIYGSVAFSRAWDWSGADGPVHRLAARACGRALGYLIPAVVACHAIYFGWIRVIY